jgi:hypothetical protein
MRRTTHSTHPAPARSMRAPGPGRPHAPPHAHTPRRRPRHLSDREPLTITITPRGLQALPALRGQPEAQLGLQQPPRLELGEHVEQLVGLRERVSVLALQLIAQLALTDLDPAAIDPHQNLPIAHQQRPGL